VFLDVEERLGAPGADRGLGELTLDFVEFAVTHVEQRCAHRSALLGREGVELVTLADPTPLGVARVAEPLVA
jgi:hypothetical protein